LKKERKFDAVSYHHQSNEFLKKGLSRTFANILKKDEFSGVKIISVAEEKRELN
jgi:hypothetical protein